MKKLITLLAVLGMVLALAPAAQAGTVPVVNGSFEEYIGTTLGTAHTTYYEYWDILAGNDATIDGHLQNLGGQPTSGPPDPTGWSYVAGGGDNLAHDARWGNWWSSWTSGPTDGGVIMIFDDRGNAQDDSMYQTLGTVAEMKALGGATLTAQIDVRSAKATGAASSTEFFAMFFRVGGVGDADSAGAWKSLLNDTWEIPDWAALGNPNNTYGTATKANPGVLAPGTVGSQNMGTFSATVDLTPFDDAADVEIVIEQVRTAVDSNGRIYVDNVRVEAIGGGGTGTVLIIR
jgi:hypothetical protein